MIRLPPAILLVSCLLAAQTPFLSVESAGPAGARLVRVVAAQIPALEVLTTLASASATPLRIDPAILDDLAGKRISIRRERVVVDELGLLIGLKVGVNVRADRGELILSPGGPEPEDLSKQALAHVEHALLGHADPQLAAALRYQRARLLLGSGAPEEASKAFSDLVADYPGDTHAADARLLAVAAALRAGMHAEGLALIASIEESREGIPPIPGAALLPARVHAAAGNVREALLRARKVASSGRLLRDRALAGLMVAEINYGLGDGRRMLDALAALPSEIDRLQKDLVPKAALARGLALKVLHDERAALIHLRKAFRTVEPPARPMVAGAIADCLASIDDLVPAWVAIREAETLEKDPAEARRFQARRAELEQALGAAGRAIETCISILSGASGPFPEADRVLATLARSLVAVERADDARLALEALASRQAWRAWALWQLAALERRAGDPERALRALARLAPGPSKAPGPSEEEVRTMRGRLLLEMGDPLQAADVFRGASGEAPR